MDKPRNEPAKGPPVSSLPLGQEPPNRTKPPSPFKSRQIHVPACIDDRCFTWCSQTSPHRTFQNSPTCHTFCWRKIQPYEEEAINTFQRLRGAGWTIHGMKEMLRTHATPGESEQEVERRLAARHMQSANQVMNRRRLSTDAERAEAFGLLVEIGVDVRQIGRPVESLGEDVGEMQTTVRQLNELYDQMERRLPESWMTDKAVKKHREWIEQKRYFLHRFLQDARNGRPPDRKSLTTAILDTERRYLHYPFPPPPTDNWSFLRGYYLHYARHPDGAHGRIESMKSLGQMGRLWLFMETMVREGREVTWMIDNASRIREVFGPRPLGKHGGKEHARVGEEGRPARTETAADIMKEHYEVVVSVEHIPPMIYRTFVDTVRQSWVPAGRLLEPYVKSFTSGQQARNLSKLWERVWDVESGPLGTLRMMSRAIERRRKGE